MADIGINGDKILRYFSGNFSEEDASYVEEIFSDKEKERALKILLSRQFEELSQEEEDDNLDQVLCRIHYDINTRLSERHSSVFDNIMKWTLRTASVIFLPLIVFYGIHIYTDVNQKKKAWVEIKAPAWTRVQFTLPDGTSGWLNSNSSVKYNGSYNTDRQVILTGEAYFDVYKNKKKPFTVITNDVLVKALGTRFNIASYQDENDVEVVLEEGKLLLNNKKMTKSYIINPNELIVYDKSLDSFSTEVVQPNKYISWTEGKLVFRNDPLDVVARKLERWYNVDVEIKGPNHSDLRLRATFVDEKLDEVLTILKRSLPIDYKVEIRDLKSDDTYTKKKVIISYRTT